MDVDAQAAYSASRVVIRRGRLGDLNSVLAIEQAAFGRHALDSSTLFWLLVRRWPGFIVADAEGIVVGYVICRVSLWPPWAKLGGINSIAVKPEHFRQGIGRRLMTAAIDYLAGLRVQAIDLEVALKNEPAKTLYTNLGFKTDTPLPDYYGTGEDGIRMRLELRR